MKRTRVALVPVLLSLVALLALAGPASAQVVLSSHGQTGEWGYLPPDDPSSPAGKCGYSGVLADSHAHLRWIKVRGPVILARDTTGGRDHQMVSWQVLIQRQGSGGTWTTVKSSSTHSATAYDDQSPAFSPIKVTVNGTTNQLWRAVIKLRWLRSGSTEGWVKERPHNYGVKWTVGTPDYVFNDACTGLAD